MFERRNTGCSVPQPASSCGPMLSPAQQSCAAAHSGLLSVSKCRVKLYFCSLKSLMWRSFFSSLIFFSSSFCSFFFYQFSTNPSSHFLKWIFYFTSFFFSLLVPLLNGHLVRNMSQEAVNNMGMQDVIDKDFFYSVCDMLYFWILILFLSSFTEQQYVLSANSFEFEVVIDIRKWGNLGGIGLVTKITSSILKVMKCFRSCSLKALWID